MSGREIFQLLYYYAMECNKDGCWNFQYRIIRGLMKLRVLIDFQSNLQGRKLPRDLCERGKFL